MDQLVMESGYSKRTLQRYFVSCLCHPPKLSVYPSEKVNLLIDGTYFSRDLCLVLYRDNTVKFTQLYRLTNGEKYEELKEDLENLLSLGVNIESITCDGHRALLKAIRVVCPKTKEELSYWLLGLATWDKTYHEYTHQKTVNPLTGKYWYTHKLLRRSFSVLRTALPHLFEYLDNPRIPKSTNGLESFFGHLKNNLVIHRGLSTTNRKNFLKWYLYFKNEKRKKVFLAIKQEE